MSAELLEFVGFVPRSPSPPGSMSDVGSVPEASHSAFNLARYVFPDGELISAEVIVYPGTSALTVNA